MRKKVVVLSLTRNEIVIKCHKKKFNISNVGMYVSAVVIFCVMSIVSLGVINKDSVTQVFNPVNSLYNDNSDVIFTNGTIANNDFSLPILGSVIENNDDEICFVVAKSIMVMAPSGGVVSECGQTLNGIKYIKIKHSNNIYSVIENVDIIGVEVSDIVKKGTDIATAKVGDIVVLKFFENDIQVSGLTITQSKISWQN